MSSEIPVSNPTPAAAALNGGGSNMQAMLVQRMRFLQMVQELAAKDVDQCVETVGLDALLLKDAPPMPSTKHQQNMYQSHTSTHQTSTQQQYRGGGHHASPTVSQDVSSSSPQHVAMRGVMGPGYQQQQPAQEAPQQQPGARGAPTAGLQQQRPNRGGTSSTKVERKTETTTHRHHHHHPSMHSAGANGLYDDGTVKVGATVREDARHAFEQQQHHNQQEQQHDVNPPPVGGPLSDQQKQELAAIIANLSLQQQVAKKKATVSGPAKGKKKKKVAMQTSDGVQTQGGGERRSVEVRESSTSPLRQPSPSWHPRTHSGGGGDKKVRLTAATRMDEDDLQMMGADGNPHRSQQHTPSGGSRPSSSVRLDGSSRPGSSNRLQQKSAADVLRISPEKGGGAASSRTSPNTHQHHTNSTQQSQRHRSPSKAEAAQHFNDTRDSLLATLESMEGELGEITQRMTSHQEREVAEENAAQARRKLEAEIDDDNDDIPHREWPLRNPRAATLADDTVDDDKAATKKKNSAGGPNRRLRGTIPAEMIHSITHNKEIVNQYVRHNESLWNSSPISQHVFSERLTNSLMQDLVGEVMEEVTEMLDDYVDGLVNYELQ